MGFKILSRSEKLLRNGELHLSHFAKISLTATRNRNCQSNKDIPKHAQRCQQDRQHFRVVGVSYETELKVRWERVQKE